MNHKVLTNIEYRAVSGVFRTIDPPTPPHTTSVSSPRTKGGGYTLAGQWGGGGSIVRKTPDIGLASYNIIPLRVCTNAAENAERKPPFNLNSVLLDKCFQSNKYCRVVLQRTTKKTLRTPFFSQFYLLYTTVHHSFLLPSETEAQFLSLQW